LRHHRALVHGRSTLTGSLDGEDARTYFQRIGGEEVFEAHFQAGLNGPVGGSVETSSRVILMQVIWNLLVRGQWTLTVGVDRIPETIASHARVVTEARVLHVEQRAKGVQVEAEVKGKQQTLRARAVIFAIPDNSCRGFARTPEELREQLVTNEVFEDCQCGGGARKAAKCSYAGYAFTPDVVSGAEIEMEHLRAPNRCPEGTGMASNISVEHARVPPIGRRR